MPPLIWLMVSNPRKGLSTATDCPTIDDAIRQAEQEAENEDLIVTIEQDGRTIREFNTS